MVWALSASALVGALTNLLAWRQVPEALIPGQDMDFSREPVHDHQEAGADLATLTPAAP